MLIVDASCLYEVLVDAPGAEQIRRRFETDGDLAAPQLVDAEVLGIIRRHWLSDRLDATSSSQAVTDLRDWPGQRYGHRLLLDRVWELRSTVRSWDGLYVALAEALDATLLTLDGRLASAPGPRCDIEVVLDA